MIYHLCIVYVHCIYIQFSFSQKNNPKVIYWFCSTLAHKLLLWRCTQLLGIIYAFVCRTVVCIPNFVLHICVKEKFLGNFAEMHTYLMIVIVDQRKIMPTIPMECSISLARFSSLFSTQSQNKNISIYRYRIVRRCIKFCISADNFFHCAFHIHSWFRELKWMRFRRGKERAWERELRNVCKQPHSKFDSSILYFRLIKNSSLGHVFEVSASDGACVSSASSSSS